MAADTKAQTVRGVVAPGHTVLVGNPPNYAKSVPDTREERGPGQDVELLADDHRRLMQAGFLLNQDGSQAIPFGNGPTFDSDKTRQNPGGVGFAGVSG